MPWSDIYGYRFSVESLTANAPDAPGVFGLFNEEGWVFIGKTLNLGHALNSCLAQQWSSVTTRINPVWCHRTS